MPAIFYHGTTEDNLSRIRQSGYLRSPFVTKNLKLAKSQASRYKGLSPLVVLKLNLTGYKISKDPMFRKTSEDPLLGKTYQVLENIPISRITEVIKEPEENYWFETISAPMYDRMIEKEGLYG